MAYLNPYNDETLTNSTEYDFTTELSPGVWKVCRQLDRVEFLAHDITEYLTKDPRDPEGNQTDLGFLVNADTPNIAGPLGMILNHENLVNMVDKISVQKFNVGGRPERRTYAIWDFCDAGNLGNLFAGQEPVVEGKNDIFRDDEWEEIDDREIQDEITKINEDDESLLKSMFLPESFCWHVLVSVLKALAWLHNGSRQVEVDNGRVVMRPNVDWEPMLHRNITPYNIFFAHPRRDEWYGSCKLGNYSRLAISSHYSGDARESARPRNKGVALAPPRNRAFQPLEELIQLHEVYGNLYPQKPDQPYTIVSEWRAFGEIMQMMMMKRHEGNPLRAVRQYPVYKNLRYLDYSNLLKNVVVALMTLDPDEKLENGNYRWTEYERHNFTTRLCSRAVQDFKTWQASENPEAKKLITVESQLAQQVEEDVLERFEEIDAKNEKNRVLREQDKLFDGQPKVYEEFVPESP
ncbi:hypothetical protein F5Y06DRAFT_302965 [Hypoxylon sp. FL0890]|nr:hypothetical protein F5Y06DRAFT_302965 [Hypoxylon sp. FL0890]